MTNAEKAAFAKAVDAYHEPLYRFAWSLARNDAVAADLTQETFAIFARKLGSLRDAAKTRSWLFTTLYREFLRLKRRDRFHAEVEPEALETLAPSIGPEGEDRADEHAILIALRNLDDAYRAPLTLFYLQQHSYREIAEILKIPLGTVMSRISRGKARLREALDLPSPPP